MEIGGFAGAAATGNNAQRNDQATEEGSHATLCRTIEEGAEPR
jgi:hypothetical protein